jgi:hypothetical protein
MMLAVITAGITGFVVAAFVSGGRRILWTCALFVIGSIVEVTPRLPDRFIRWYNDALDGWKR